MKFNYFENIKRHKAIDKVKSKFEELQKLYAEDEELRNKQNQEDRLIENAEADQKQNRGDTILAMIVFCINILILGICLTASIMSGSLSIMATLLDSIMDIASNGIINCSLWAVNHTNQYDYPRGRNKLECLSILICSVIMGVANIMMIVQALEAILNNEIDPKVDLLIILIVLSGSAIKLVLMLVCIKHGSNNSRLLSKDLRNDIITSVLTLIAAYIGTKVWKYADPIGAVIVCACIAINWFRDAISHIPMIVGVSAEQKNISRILNIAINHSKYINKIDFISIYHVGEKSQIELHIVLDKSLPLQLTHHISESLQRHIETLEFVERVFIHCDYRCDQDQNLKKGMPKETV
uniref:ZT_dimer domain-containing protein n=1 Tax=Rhabditophanes sp. KR3021 TaxID=114890 RepID=A0AC35TJ84_9BILA